MTITTKYDRNQTVFIIRNKDILKTVVRWINISDEYGAVQVRYNFCDTVGNYYYLEEKDVFETKEKAALAWLDSQNVEVGIMLRDHNEH